MCIHLQFQPSQEKGGSRPCPPFIPWISKAAMTHVHSTLPPDVTLLGSGHGHHFVSCTKTKPADPRRTGFKWVWDVERDESKGLVNCRLWGPNSRGDCYTSPTPRKKHLSSSQELFLLCSEISWEWTLSGLPVGLLSVSISNEPKNFSSVQLSTLSNYLLYFLFCYLSSPAFVLTENFPKGSYFPYLEDATEFLQCSQTDLFPVI